MRRIISSIGPGIFSPVRFDIFRIIRAAADAGAGVLIASSEYEDLAHLCDRVLVLHHGRPGVELSGAGLTEDAITRSCLLSARPAPAAGPARTARSGPAPSREEKR